MTAARRSGATIALLSLAAAGTITGASPGAAAGATSTRYAATWTFAPGVHADGSPVEPGTAPGVVAVLGPASGLQLTDYAGTTYYDRVTGSHAGSSTSVGGSACRQTSKDPAGITLYGERTDWAQMLDGQAQGARVTISCVIAGAHHRFHWGNHGTANGGYDPARTTDCIRLTRSSRTTFTLDTRDCLVTQEVVYNGRLQQIADPPDELIPFTATVTVPGLE